MIRFLLKNKTPRVLFILFWTWHEVFWLPFSDNDSRESPLEQKSLLGCRIPIDMNQRVDNYSRLTYQLIQYPTTWAADSFTSPPYHLRTNPLQIRRIWWSAPTSLIALLHFSWYRDKLVPRDEMKVDRLSPVNNSVRCQGCRIIY